MKRTGRKLTVRVETLRSLTDREMKGVVGGQSSQAESRCSTDQHATHCPCETFSDYCGTGI
jgi:hypothetical protein